MASGMRNMKRSLIYEIRKCPVVKKKPDGAVEQTVSKLISNE